MPFCRTGRISPRMDFLLTTRRPRAGLPTPRGVLALPVGRCVVRHLHEPFTRLSSSTGLHNTIGAGGPIAKVVVIGAGSWGTTVANLLAQKGLDVTLCPREADLASCIARSHENSR